MQTQIDTSLYCRKAYDIMRSSGVSLLDALRQSTNYDFEIYKEVVIFLAKKLSFFNYQKPARWPIYALDLACWENEDTRSASDFRILLCDF